MRPNSVMVTERIPKVTVSVPAVTRRFPDVTLSLSKGAPR
jgi:hypothetical protein